MNPRLLTVVALACALTACSFSRPAPLKQSYLLHAARPAGTAPATKPDEAALRINRFSVAQPADGRPLVYRSGEARYELDFYNEFLALPATMLTERTQAWLADARLFAAVVPMTSSIDARYVLEGAAYRMAGDYRDGAAPRATLGIRYILAREDAPANILLDRAYEQAVPLGDRSADALVAGYDHALARILGELERDVTRILATSR